MDTRLPVSYGRELDGPPPVRPTQAETRDQIKQWLREPALQTRESIAGVLAKLDTLPVYSDLTTDLTKNVKSTIEEVMRKPVLTEEPAQEEPVPEPQEEEEEDAPEAAPKEPAPPMAA